eukprot:UC1_evm1s1275
MLSVSSAVEEVLRAALDAPPKQLLTAAGDSVTAAKALCARAPDAASKDELRSALARLVPAAKALADASSSAAKGSSAENSSPLARIRLLTQLGDAAEMCQGAARDLEAACGESGDATAATVAPVPAPKRDADLDDIGSQLAGALEELTQALQQWHVQEAVALVTHLVRSLPLLLHRADGLEENPAVSAARARVVGATGAMTRGTRAVVRAPEDTAAGPELLGEVTELSSAITAFIEELQALPTAIANGVETASAAAAGASSAASTPVKPNVAAAGRAAAREQLRQMEAMLTQRNESMAASRRASLGNAGGAGRDALRPEVAEARDEAKHALGGLAHALDETADPVAVTNYLEDLVVSTCTLLDLADRTCTPGGAHETLRADLLHGTKNLVGAVAPLCAEPENDIDTGTPSALAYAVSAKLDPLNDIVDDLATAATDALDAAATQHSNGAGVVEPPATPTPFAESDGAATTALTENDEEVGYVVVGRGDRKGGAAGEGEAGRPAQAPLGAAEQLAADQIPRVDVAVAICSRTTSQKKSGAAMQSGSVLDFEGLQTGASVADLKILVASRCDIPEAEQELVLHNKVLTDKATLHDAKLVPGEFIFLFDRREITADQTASSPDVGEAGMTDDASGARLPASGLDYTMGSVSRDSVASRAPAGSAKRSQQTRDEEHRIALMNLVKAGRLSISDAVFRAPTQESAAATLAARAVERQLAEERMRDEASMTVEDGMYANVARPLRGSRPSSQAPAEAAAELPALNESEMSIAGFSATSARRPFARSKKRPVLLREGYLNKEGGSRKTWKTRWMTLTTLELCYFKGPTDKKPLGVVHLEDYTGVEPVSVDIRSDKRKFCFRLIPRDPGARIYVCQANTTAEMLEWIEVIERALPRIRTQEERIAVLQECVNDLEERGVDKFGIFRQQGNLGQIRKIMDEYESSTEDIDFSAVVNPLTVAGFLKKAIQGNTVDLVPSEVQKLLAEAIVESEDLGEQYKSINNAVEICEPMVAKELLRSMVNLFAGVLRNSDTTKITLEELARSFGLAIFPDIEEASSHHILQLLISRSSEDE